mgnify:CR=1 FL=1
MLTPDVIGEDKLTVRLYIHGSELLKGGEETYTSKKKIETVLNKIVNGRFTATAPQSFNDLREYPFKPTSYEK